VKKFLLSVLALTLGVGVGGASAYGVGLVRSEEMTLLAPKLTFVPAGTMTAPLVFSDGRLSAYISFDVQLEVASGATDDVKARLPVLMHAVNMRTYREPLASGPDGLIPELGLLRKVVAAAAAETYGADVVQRVVVTRASPI
jgi:hypothetical protein